MNNLTLGKRRKVDFGIQLVRVMPSKMTHSIKKINRCSPCSNEYTYIYQQPQKVFSGDGWFTA